MELGKSAADLGAKAEEVAVWAAAEHLLVCDPKSWKPWWRAWRGCSSSCKQGCRSHQLGASQYGLKYQHNLRTAPTFHPNPGRRSIFGFHMRERIPGMMTQWSSMTLRLTCLQRRFDQNTLLCLCFLLIIAKWLYFLSLLLTHWYA
ncbi:hypothetical protein DUNSADRAFT_17449 [Dunaliella salina]|uniref:Encoded protein n=1 Tax=Dunaliella salina TaxID=3046 RepID=A0ABQ7H051_DUNSA|nr:hypothetical protein DUNSADRAFT_17449 [Dunaliella salina]|eukprot:KAF5840231.1 hypothetical protein DUNSADRAFT_17449 [Dunaliella salina]